MALLKRHPGDGEAQRGIGRQPAEARRAPGTGGEFVDHGHPALKLGKATAHRFLATLEDLGLVNRSANSGQYRLGLAAIRIGVAAGNQIELRRELRPYLRDLMERTGETANLVILDGTRPVFIDNVESPQNLRLLSRIGRRTHPYCTSVGKALLAYMKPEELETILAAEPFERRTERSIALPRA